LSKIESNYLVSSAEAKLYYETIGIETLPLPVGSKVANARGWESRISSSGWEVTNEDENIGIWCGGPMNIAVIDCDTKNGTYTFENVVGFLDGLGVPRGSYPVVETQSGSGKQIYLRLNHQPVGNYMLLDKRIGVGEFKFGNGAYVAAPPSVVDNPFTLLSGGFYNLPILDIHYLSPMVQGEFVFSKSNNDKKWISEKAKKLLNGELLDKYDFDKSRAEQALVVSLLSTGQSKGDIWKLCMQYRGPGYFKYLNKINPELAMEKFETSYQNGVEYVMTPSPERQNAQNAIVWGRTKSWPGRSGGTDRAIYLAHAQSSWNSGKTIYHAAERSLADLSNLSHVTARAATLRLIEQGLLMPEREGETDMADSFQLIEVQKSADLPEFDNEFLSSAHDAFCYRGLGNDSRLIYEHLKLGSKTVEELVLSSGKIKRTVTKWLDRMSSIIDFRTDEINFMVFELGGLWHVNPRVNLDHIAIILGVDETNRKRMQKHAIERLNYKVIVERSNGARLK
jgi:hypothetical protein